MAQKPFQEDIIQPTHMDKRDEKKPPKSVMSIQTSDSIHEYPLGTKYKVRSINEYNLSEDETLLLAEHDSTNNNKQQISPIYHIHHAAVYIRIIMRYICYDLTAECLT